MFQLFLMLAMQRRTRAKWFKTIWERALTDRQRSRQMPYILFKDMLLIKWLIIQGKKKKEKNSVRLFVCVSACMWENLIVHTHTHTPSHAHTHTHTHSYEDSIYPSVLKYYSTCLGHLSHQHHKKDYHKHEHTQWYNTCIDQCITHTQVHKNADILYTLTRTHTNSFTHMRHYY